MHHMCACDVCLCACRRRYVPEFLSTIHQATLRQKAVLVAHQLKDFPTNDEIQARFIQHV